jgi:hypothetical protein
MFFLQEVRSLFGWTFGRFPAVFTGVVWGLVFKLFLFYLFENLCLRERFAVTSNRETGGLTRPLHQFVRETNLLCFTSACLCPLEASLCLGTAFPRLPRK